MTTQITDEPEFKHLSSPMRENNLNVSLTKTIFSDDFQAFLCVCFSQWE